VVSVHASSSIIGIAATEMFVDSLEKRTDLSDAQFTPAALEHL